MNLVDAIKNSMLAAGAQWVMWLLVGLSVIEGGIVLERLIFFYWRAGGDISQLRRQLVRDVRNSDFATATAYLNQSRHPAAKVALQGLARVVEEADRQQVEQSMQAEQLAQRALLERNLGFLGTLGSNAPFVGLLGTVIGIVEAFNHLGTASAGISEQNGNQLIMRAIAEALVATAVGIGVAIPAIFAFNQLMRVAKSKLQTAELLSKELIANAPNISLGKAEHEA